MDMVMSKGLELLERNESFVMAIIINQSGSTPRNMGAKMIIRSNEECIGTIGGGIVEANIQSLAREVLQSKGPIIKDFVLDKKEVADMDMICGGRLALYLKYVDAGNKNYENVYREACRAKEEDESGWFITLIAQGPSDGVCEQWFLSQDMELGGEGFSKSEEEELKEFALRTNKTSIFTSKNNNKYLIEYLGYLNKAYIFGAGHIGHKLAPLLSYVGFYTVVIDDREKYANKERFTSADELIVLDDFERAMDGLQIDKNSYLIIVTRGHEYDQTVLAQALRTEALYIGMIGSLKKRDQIYNNLMGEGFKKEELDNVFSPIGLDIGGDTPEEISISIVAELVDVRAKAANAKGKA